MLKNLKNKKKKGFTLVELVVVIAIIAILAAVLVPQITGYIKESRKTEVIEEARKVVMFADAMNSKSGSDVISDGATVSTVLGRTDAQEFIADFAKIDKISGLKVGNCREILDTDTNDIKLGDDYIPTGLINRSTGSDKTFGSF